MSLDDATVRRVAALARIRLSDADLPRVQGELNAILGWIEQLQAVNTDGVAPMAGGAPEQAAPMAGGAPEQAAPMAGGAPEQAAPMAGGAPEGASPMPMRDDVVTDGGIAERVLANAPDRELDYFAVPKVVE